MRTLVRFTAAVVVVGGLNLYGTSALAETPPASPDELGIDEPEPDPVPNPDIPFGPGELTDDPCDPVEGECGGGDPVPNPDIPPGPGQFTDDPCDPVEGACGGGTPDDGDDPEEPLDEPELPGGLDDLRPATPTFTG
jgi:hypothetical protein